MKYLQQKDLRYKQKFFTQEINKKINKFLFVYLLNNNKIQEKTKTIIKQFFLHKTKRQTLKTKLMRRCLISNRSRVNYQLLGLSRIKMRELIKEKQLPGFDKNIW